MRVKENDKKGVSCLCGNGSRLAVTMSVKGNADWYLVANGRSR